MAELFGVGVPAISKHLKNIFDSGELEEEVVVSILETTTEHGAVASLTQTQQVKYYNLDAVISVGYPYRQAMLSIAAFLSRKVVNIILRLPGPGIGPSCRDIRDRWC